jgi:deoxyhypusine synthase
MPVDPKHYHDGFQDGLTPLEPIDPARCGNVDQLLRAYARTAFGGRALGEAADVLEAMIRDSRCLVVATLSGAMTVAKQGLLLCEMIDRGWVQAVVSTGALMAHGFVEAAGGTHFKYDPSMNDWDLFEKGYDRVYDTLELEKNLDAADLIVREVLDRIPDDTVLCSSLILRELGRHLDETTPPDARAVLRSAYRRNVPVFVPAFTDSEMGLDLALHNLIRVRNGVPRRPFDPFRDLEAYARLVSVQRRTGLFTIGGGVPRNWAQQLGPFLDLIDKRTGGVGRGYRFRYGVRVCPEPVHWGGLSGCTYSEGVSWGKFLPPHKGGRFAEVYADATIVWPLLVRGMIERLGDAPSDKELAPSDDSPNALFNPTSYDE